MYAVKAKISCPGLSGGLRCAAPHLPSVFFIMGGLTSSGKVEEREGGREKGIWCGRERGQESKEGKKRLREWNGVKTMAARALNKSLSHQQISSLSLGGA